MLFLAYVQTPPPADVKPVLHRTYRRHQTDRYSVEVDSEGGGGSAHFEYEVKMFAERVVDKSTDTKVDVSFLNLKSSYNDLDAPDKKLFGTATYQFPVTGFPLDYSLGGENSSIVLPILSWYLPIGQVAPGSDFKVDPMRFDGAFTVAGTGTLVSEDSKTAKIKLDLTITAGAPNTGKADGVPHFNSVAVFDIKTGVLVSAEGGLEGGSGGSMTFKLKRI